MISRSEVIDKVIEQIKKDILDEDLTCIEELLTFVPLENLIGFLPEDQVDDLLDTSVQ